MRLLVQFHMQSTVKVTRTPQSWFKLRPVLILIPLLQQLEPPQTSPPGSIDQERTLQL